MTDTLGLAVRLALRHGELDAETIARRTNIPRARLAELYANLGAPASALEARAIGQAMGAFDRGAGRFERALAAAIHNAVAA